MVSHDPAILTTYWRVIDRVELPVSLGESFVFIVKVPVLFLLHFVLHQ